MITRTAPGSLRALADLGVLEPADVHVARALARLTEETDDAVLLAVALTVRAVRQGSVCLDLDGAQADVVAAVEAPDAELPPWPDGLLRRVAASRLVTGDEAPLHLEGSLLYLDRYWRQERLIAEAVDERRSREARPVDVVRLDAALRRLFPQAEDQPDRQRLAAALATQRWLTLLAGGPGTGKTVTVARMLAAIADQPEPGVRIALAAPTGKAAARLEEAVRGELSKLPVADRERVGEPKASTVHRLLGWKPGARTRFLHDRDHPLPYDVVVLDEASMVSLTMMARLLESVPESARLVLVGDPDQLASVEAGAVLGDLVRRPAPMSVALSPWLPPGDLASTDEGALRAGVVTLTQVHRSDREITEVAAAIRAGEGDRVVELITGASDRARIRLVTESEADEAIRADVVTSGSALIRAAEAGDAVGALAALGRHRLLCAHLAGPFGVVEWGHRVEGWLSESFPVVREQWYVGRPLLVTGNDPILGLFNGDTGVVVWHEGRPQAAFPGADGPRLIATNRLGEIATVHAMSVHKSQGSEFDAVTLVLPPVGSPLLTRELFYTAVTRARHEVRIVGTADAVRAAVQKRIHRASGL